jgi:scyllo-inositol 2-dehydrogenase (NADP+)
LTIRTGLLGYGLGGRAFHVPLIRATPGLELAAVATSKTVPGLPTVPDPRTIIGDPGIDLVIVSTPNDTHHPLACAALDAGKHVVIDKPFAVTLGEADDLIARANARGLKLSVFHNRRWDGDFLTVRTLLASGVLGEVMRYEAHWDRFRPVPADSWKEQAGPGRGVLVDLGPHLIDQALILFGAPDRIDGDVERQREGSQVDDYFAITFHYGNRRVIMTSSLLAADPRPRFGIYGSKGSFVKYGLDPQEAQAQAGLNPDDPEFGVEDAQFHGKLTLADGTSERVPSERGDYRAFYVAMAAAIADGAPVPVDPADARAGMAIIAAAASRPEGGAPAA